MISSLPVFWGMPTAVVGGAAAAAGIALINSMGNVAGFFATIVVGWMTQLTGSTQAAMYMMAAVLVMGGAIAVMFLLPWLDKSPVKSYRYRGWLSWTLLLLFALSFLWLAKIGGGPGTDPSETVIGRILTVYYFLFFLTMPVWTKLDKTKPVPERVTTHD